MNRHLQKRLLAAFRKMDDADRLALLRFALASAAESPRMPQPGSKAIAGQAEVKS